ncbi:hypothetical protein G6O69_31505 [Pseudenhygromyxa sp. WMMC2535]|uniref:hypothetical protein n=1 Tax=Pseudenhygromyxa sp. WMMC2535 TaxID=2712867 RepID=UPI001555BEAD|nr:hypothetical protein [Pseudenhygromyxa sp. WMMC2535]NVB42392.1 hypothetical protein [Pseudenhygromyxa sp. WMMC2535]
MASTMAERASLDGRLDGCSTGRLDAKSSRLSVHGRRERRAAGAEPTVSAEPGQQRTSDEKGHEGDEGRKRPPGASERAPWGVANIALIAGILQVLASIALGLARVDRFAAAASESPQIYMLAAALITAGVFSIWLVRERPLIAVALALIWPVGLWLGLHQRVTILGLAYHGEFVLHHFSALLCLVLAVTLPLSWARDPRLGRLRPLPAALALPGAALLIGAHLAPLHMGPPWLGERWVASLGGALLLGSWPLSMATFWTRMAPPQRRWIAPLLLLPVLTRLALAGPEALSGALVPPALVPWLGAAIVVSAMTLLVLLRPRLELWVMVVVGVLCLITSTLFYLFYEQGFGELEDGLGGLLESLLGFRVPYPSYVDELRSAALMMGLFFLHVAVYAALVSTEDRVRGVSLGLMLIAGLGFSSPHLVLMLGVGALLFIETLLPGAPHRELRHNPFGPGPGFGGDFELGELGDPDDPDSPEDASASAARDPETGRAALLTCFEGLAERLHTSPPTQVEGPRGVAVNLRDELDGVPFDFIARVETVGVRVELIVGLPGRSDPIFELLAEPGDRGQRPAHLIARSHRVHGDIRALEAWGDAPLDALSSFSTAYLRAWEAGAQVELGRDLSGLRVDALEALVRALARVCA